MQKRETKMPLRSWVTPEVNRLASGSAELAGDTSTDGSGLFS
ncbi:MAG TPA: hypothetical protein VF605_10480 [Allosphingosinicella sp.]|jgi:hypothetical protein